MSHETAIRTAALIRHNAVLLLRDPGALISRMVLPLAFLVLLHPLYQAAQGRSPGPPAGLSVRWQPAVTGLSAR